MSTLRRMSQREGAARGARAGLAAAGRVQGAVRRGPVHRAAPRRRDAGLAEQHGCRVRLGGAGGHSKHLPHHQGEMMKCKYVVVEQRLHWQFISTGKEMHQ